MSGPRNDAPDLARTFVEIAELAFDYEIGECLHVLVHVAAEHMEADTGGVLLETSTGQLEVAATLSDQRDAIEKLEIETGSGPCIDAFRQSEAVVVEDLAAHVDRWPEFVPQVLDMGLRSVVAYPIGFRGQRLGSLNLYRRQPIGVTPDRMDVVRAMIDAAAVGIVQQRAVASAETHTGHLRRALQTRVAVEQAKGLLADRHKATPVQAFQAVRRYARDHRVTVHDVCQELVDNVMNGPTVLDEKIAGYLER